MKIKQVRLPAGGLAGLLAQPDAADMELAWLGQAGFLLRVGGQVVLIDPYLSDHLASKYRGARFPHTRMMPAPIKADALPRVDLVICTHRHGDHMDPGTLPILAKLHPRCRFVVPAVEAAFAERMGLPAGRLMQAEAGLRLQPLPDLDLVLDPLAAAHEHFEQDRDGRHHFLGYVVSVHGLRLYHSGDCVPYEGLAEAVRALLPEVALLPVNGRDAGRAANGIPGNFTLDEAIDLCRAAGVATLIPHHFGLFAFNTADPAEIDAAARRTRRPRLLRPDTRRLFQLTPTASNTDLSQSKAGLPLRGPSDCLKEAIGTLRPLRPDPPKA